VQSVVIKTAQKIPGKKVSIFYFSPESD